MFIGFTNFYQRFIQGFSKIAILLISLLKTTGSSKELTPKAFKVDGNEVVGGSSDRTNETIVNLSKNKKSRTLTHVLNIRAIGKSTFLTLDAKKAFNYLRLAFIKAPIL